MSLLLLVFGVGREGRFKTMPHRRRTSWTTAIAAEDGRIMTIEQAKLCTTARLFLRGNVIKHEGDDRYLLRDKLAPLRLLFGSRF